METAENCNGENFRDRRVQVPSHRKGYMVLRWNYPAYRVCA